MINKLSSICPGKSTKGMGLLQYENTIIENKAELLDHIFNMSDKDFDSLFDEILKNETNN